MQPPRRGRLDLPETAEIQALLADVTAPAPTRPAGSVLAGLGKPTAPAAKPTAKPATADTPRPWPEVPATEFLRGVNWTDDPARAAALQNQAGRPWEVGAYFQTFLWD